MYNILKIFGAPTTSSSSTSAANDPGKYIPSDTGDLQANVTAIINGIIAVLGFVCVVVMIVGGVNYMISAGDSSKVTKAKNTILYGLIGLVICVLAFAIVNFVIVNIIGNTN